MKKTRIHRMIERDIDATYFFLGNLVKKHCTFKNLHNFGVIISKYGKEIKYCPYNCFLLAEKLFLESITKKPTYYSYKELGDLYFDNNMFQFAIDTYLNALKYGENYNIFKKISLSYFKLKEYTDSIIYLKKAILFCFDLEEQILLKELLSFAYILSGDKNNSRILFNEITKMEFYDKSLDTLRLAYLCEEYEYILKNYNEVLNIWRFEADIIQIILKAYFKIKPLYYEDAVNLFLNKIKKFYLDNPEFDNPELNELLNAIKDTPKIINVNFVPNFVWECDFI